MADLSWTSAGEVKDTNLMLSLSRRCIESRYQGDSVNKGMSDQRCG